MRPSAWFAALTLLLLPATAVAQDQAAVSAPLPVEAAAPEPEAEPVPDAAPPPADPLASSPPAPPESLQPSPAAREIFDRYVPAMVLVRYIANVSGAEGGVRSARQIGVLVDADGLVLLGGHLQALNMKPFDFHVRTGHGDDTTEHDGKLLSRVGPLNVSYVRIVRKDDAASDTEETAETPADEDRDTTRNPFPFVAFDADPTVEIGDPVWVFGILPEQAGSAFSLREQHVVAILEEPSTVYVVDGTPTPGENGGLVINRAGDAIGVLGYELSQQQGGEVYVRHNLPLIFPAATLRASIAKPREETPDQADESWFGILIQPLRDDFKEYFGLEEETGCIVSNVVAGSPAERAGLARGDIIVALNGEPVDVPNDLALLTFTRAIRDLPVGTTVTVQYLRDGEPHEVTADLEAQPKMAAKADTMSQPAWGLRVRELTQDIIYILNLPRDLTGVVVDKVEQGGPAQAAGLQPGDVIRDLNGHLLDDLADYRESTDQLAGMRSDSIVLFVQRGSRTGFTKIEPDWSLPPREE